MASAAARRFLQAGALALTWALASCALSDPVTPLLPTAAIRVPTQTTAPPPTQASPIATSLPSYTPAALTRTFTPTATLPVVGPGYRPGFNPLTGLPVSDPGTLFTAPLLVSITQFPPSARPQAGLSAAAQVWETSIGEGMSRFLAVYYGDYLEVFARLLEGHPDFDLADPVLGPIRSGRVGYEEIKRLYPQALLITRFASPEVAEQLTDLVTVYADDPEDVNSAMLTLEELQALEIPATDPSAYAQLVFDPAVPPGGTPAASLDVIFNLYDQIRWDYDPRLGTYLRSQNLVDGTDTFHPSFDRLNGSQLAAANVVVLFAQHKFENLAGTILNIELSYLPKRNGVLFRDGRMYPIHWSTRSAELRLVDADGEPIALKPGTTYFEVVSYQSTWDEARHTVRFHNPPLPTLTPTPSLTPSPSPSATEEPAP